MNLAELLQADVESDEYAALTYRQRELIKSLEYSITDGTWGLLAPNTVNYAEHNLPTPKGLGAHVWVSPTYARCLFLTVVQGRRWSVTLTISRAPWLPREIRSVSLARATSILANPAGEFE